MYYALAGKPPFGEGPLPQRLIAHQRQPAPSIDKVRPDAPTALVAICLKMMAKKPADRFQSAREVAEALAQWQASQATVAPAACEAAAPPQAETATGPAAAAETAPARGASAVAEPGPCELRSADTARRVLTGGSGPIAPKPIRNPQAGKPGGTARPREAAARRAGGPRPTSPATTGPAPASPAPAEQPPEAAPAPSAT
jgi:hypothetical protein